MRRQKQAEEQLAEEGHPLSQPPLGRERHLLLMPTKVMMST